MDKSLVPLKKKIETIASQVAKFEIVDAGTMKEAVTVLSTLNSYADSVKEKKETITKPLNTALKAARAMFAPLEDTYEGAIDMLRSKMTKYQTQEVARKQAEELAIANRVKEGRGNLSVETAVKKIAELKPVDKEVATDAGLVQFREVKRFEVMDITLLPIDYHTPNETMISKAMKDGKELPGVRYYSEQVPVNYR